MARQLAAGAGAAEDRGAARAVAATRGRWVARAGALAAGVPLAGAFPELSLWWLAWVALVPLLLVVRAAPSGREAAVRAWLGGAGFFGAACSWLAPVTGLFMLPLALVMGLAWAPWGWVAWWCLRPGAPARRLALAPLAVPTAWVAAEYARSWESFGGPWVLAGASQWNQPATLAAAAVGGVWLVGFLVVAANAALAAAVAAAPARRVAAGLLLAAAAAAAAGPAWAARRPPPEVTGTVRLALVQPGRIDPVGPRFAASERITRELAATAARRGQGADLVVWGESSVGLDPLAQRAYLERLRAAARAAGADLLVNVDARRGPGGIFKTALLVGEGGVRGRYDKLRLVPFGEYVPLRPVLGWVASVTPAAAEDRRRGADLAVLRSGPYAIGPLVCFESSFPDLARTLARRGADLIVVQSATTTFQESWGPEQHASLVAVRAVESGRPVVQAALSGVTTAADPRGQRLAWLPTSFQGGQVVTIPLSRAATPYVRWGDWLPRAATAALLLLATAAAVRWACRAATRRLLPAFGRPDADE